MFTKSIIIITMAMIVISLASALLFLIRDEGKTKRTILALSIRIGLSIGLFVFLLLGVHFNWITPHGIS